MKKECGVSKGRAAFLSVFLYVLLGIALFAFAVPMVQGEQPALPSTYEFPLGPESVLFLNSTAYNSLESQTDSTPFITATGETTQSGIVALSRDLLELFPYGSTVDILDIRAHAELPNGCGATMNTVRRLEPYPGLLPGQFRVSDTLHPRKVAQLDMWLEHLDDANRWGVCEVVIRPLTPTPTSTQFIVASGNK